MRIPYRSYPSTPSKAFPQKIEWWPVVPVRLVDEHLQRKTKAFHAIVDSGSAACLFHAESLIPLGLKLEDGIEDSIGGIGKQTQIPVYYHDIYILIGIDWKIGVRAGFSRELSVAGVLGRLGFFTAFRVILDHSNHPPVIEIERIKPSVVH